MDLLRSLQAKHPKQVFWAETQAMETEADLQGNLKNYNREGYANMTQDISRNKRYKLAIEFAVKEKEKLRWVEVGPGADAVLTKMVLEADNDTEVLAIEGNPGAIASARANLKKYKDRVKLISALSTDEAAKTALVNYEKQGEVEAVVQEILGFFASSEGVANIIAGLKQDLQAAAIFVPSRAATFCTPVLFSKQDLHFDADIYVVDNGFSLIRKMPILACREKTGGNWSPKAAALEVLDFQSDENLARKHKSRTEFVTTRAAQVNGIACWIWCETGKHGAPKRLAQTKYPYSSLLPPRAADRIDFSSLWEDEDARGLGWRNVLIPLAKTLIMAAGDSLVVDFMADLRTPTPNYKLSIWHGHDEVETEEVSLTIRNVNPVFEADK